MDEITLSYREKGAALRRVGINPYPGVTKFSESQKRHLRRLWAKYKEIAEAPEQFAVRLVSHKNAAIMREQGLAVYKNTVAIPKHGYPDVHVRAGKIIKSGIPGKTAITPLVRPVDLYGALEKQLKKLKKGEEYLTVQIGDNGPFSSVMFSSMQSLAQYMRQWTPRVGRGPATGDQAAQLKRELLTKMTIVKLSMPIDETPAQEKARLAAAKKIRKFLKGKK